MVTYRRQKFLYNDIVRYALRNGIPDSQNTHPFTIDAWVLLPDHLHCILTLARNDANFGIRWAIIKRSVSKQCSPELHRDDWMNASKRRRKESTLWQRRFWEHMIRDEWDFEKHFDYIHYNPVKHNLVSCAVGYPYSTFLRYMRKGLCTKTWGVEALKKQKRITENRWETLLMVRKTHPTIPA